VKETDVAYAAGFFDGEGHVRCDIVKGYPMLSLNVSQNERRPLEWLQILFGGHIHAQRGNKRSLCFVWQVNTNEAARFIEVVLPYLMVKEAEAQEALDKWNERLTR
jgi:hypothetical protein